MPSRTSRSMRFVRSLLAGVCACALGASLLAGAENEMDLRLRIEWGSGTARQWTGSVRVAEGKLSDPRVLAVEADAPGSLTEQAGVLLLHPPSPRAYDGLDVTVTARREAKVQIDMSPTDPPHTSRRLEFSLAELKGDRGLKRIDLDDRGNQLLVRRVPGDTLRVEMVHGSIVLTTDEPFHLRIVPHEIDAPAGQYRCHIQLFPAHADDELWSQTVDVRMGDDGVVSPIGPVAVELPAEEGVYDVAISLSKKRRGVPFVSSSALYQRRVQVVVIDPKPPTRSEETWRNRLTIDPTNSKWWEQLTRLSPLNRLSGARAGPLGSRKATVVEHQGRKLIQLSPGEWQAYPLPVAEPGRPHLIEIEYPADRPQVLGISVVEPNAGEQVVPIGLDSGVEVPRSIKGDSQPAGVHRLVFWPRTDSPVLLLTNRKEESAAWFATIRLLDGPTGLPAPASGLPAPTEFPAAPMGAAGEERLVAAYFDKPLFPENFSAPQLVDEQGNALHDWVTFYHGGRRLIEYLQYAGYNGAVLSAVCEGSALYPSPLLQPTPKYDMGVFANDARDVGRKDVLELLFRLFDREGLKLIPAIQFATPLPELEQLRRSAPDPSRADQPRSAGLATTPATALAPAATTMRNAGALELVGTRGRSWLAENRPREGLAPYYNPLDARVQAAMRRVIQELLERYAHHESFGGVTLQLGRTTFAQFPDADWGWDRTTVAAFEADSGVQIQWSAGDRVADLSEVDKQLWIQWRAQRLAQFHKQLADDVVRRRPEARFYLAGADLLNSPAIEREVRESLLRPLESDTVTQAMLRIGIDPDQYLPDSHVVLLRPQRFAPTAPLGPPGGNQAINVSTSGSPEVDQLFDRSPAPGSLLFHETEPLALRSFDEVSPFGPERTQVLLFSHFAPHEEESRRRFIHSLATLDAQAILDGGWMIPLGQERALRPILEAFRHLPAERFETLPGERTQPVVMRTLVRQDRTFIYLVNNSPWPVSVRVQLTVPVTCQVQPLGRRTLPPLQSQGDQTIWELDLQPYDLVAAVLLAANARPGDWSVSYDKLVEIQLRQRVQDLQARADLARTVTQLGNPGFESDSEENRLPGWIHTPLEPGGPLNVDVDTRQKNQGQRSLRVSSHGGVAWVRSDPIEPPKLGRLSLTAWLRVADPALQPPLRIGVDGKWNGQPYYRPANVGAKSDRKISDKWQPYVIVLDDLPQTGLTDLRIAFDLKGAGEVWIDDVQLAWLDEKEHRELEKSLFAASFAISSGEVLQCTRFLDSYWPRLLEERLPMPPAPTRPRLADRPDPPAKTARPSDPLPWYKRVLPRKLR